MTDPRRCKILCTLGPASASADAIGSLIDAGMNAARLNFSHGEHPVHAATYARVRAEASRRGRPVAILADLQGPKIRVGKIPEPGFELAEGETLVLAAGTDEVAARDGGRALVPTPFAPLAREVSPGETILLNDGAIELEVTAVEGAHVVTRVICGGLLSSNKGINLPGTSLSVPALTDKDRVDLAFALELGVDLVALSFVRQPSDVLGAREIMDRQGRRCPIIAKIEKPQAIEHLDGIVEAADGIMVARGDLGVEMGPESVPILQKRVIERANASGKLVITATQMLESMITHPRPTRAEASDVANAVLDGSDALMLSGETAVGNHPSRVVQTMDRIIRSTEEAPRYWASPPEDLDSPVGRFLEAIASFPKPLVTAVHGAAVGVGVTLLLYSDLAYAAAGTRFKLPFVQLGLVPEAASTYLLPRMLGYRRATELLLTGDPFGPEEALSAGLINEVLPPGRCWDRARERAEHLARQPPGAMRDAKALLRRGDLEAVRETMLREAEVFMARLRSPETAEAISAFFQKRAPRFD